MASPDRRTTRQHEPAGPRNWNASDYHALELPHAAWGRRVLDEIDALVLPDDALVMDAGVGTGRDVAELLQRHPALRVLAVDGSQAMLDQARSNLDDRRVQYLHADLQRPLQLQEQLDAIISVATFHWVKDHATLFSNLFNELRPGAHLIAECGGTGNLTAVNAAIAQVTGRPSGDTWEFPDDRQTDQRLSAAGFEVLAVGLRPAPFKCESRATLERFLRTVILGAEVDRLPEDDVPAFVAEVADAMATLEIDYVRLDLHARRPV